jgi:hypothetical protein
MALYGGEDRIGFFRGNDGDELSFVGHVKRIEPQQFTGPANSLMDGNFLFFYFKTQTARVGQFDQ